MFPAESASFLSCHVQPNPALFVPKTVPMLLGSPFVASDLGTQED